MLFGILVRLREEGLNELMELMPQLKSLPPMGTGADFMELLQAQEPTEESPPAVDFPLFVRSVKWMWARKFLDVQELLH